MPERDTPSGAAWRAAVQAERQHLNAVVASRGRPLRVDVQTRQLLAEISRRHHRAVDAAIAAERAAVAGDAAAAARAARAAQRHSAVAGARCREVISALDG